MPLLRWQEIIISAGPHAELISSEAKGVLLTMAGRKRGEVNEAAAADAVTNETFAGDARTNFRIGTWLPMNLSFKRYIKKNISL